MSDTGLYSNWYERVRTIAELVDQALLELQANGPQRKSMTLKDVLTKPSTSATLARQVLNILVRDAHADLNLSKLGFELSSQNVPAGTIADLEKPAELLEHERANTMAQLRK